MTEECAKIAYVVDISSEIQTKIPIINISTTTKTLQGTFELDKKEQFNNIRKGKSFLFQFRFLRIHCFY